MNTGSVLFSILLLFMVEIGESDNNGRLGSGTYGLSEQEVELVLTAVMSQSEYNYSDYTVLVPLFRAKGYGDFNAQWVTCFLSKADSSLLLVFIDEHTGLQHFIPRTHFPGAPEKTKNFLSLEYVLKGISETHTDITEPELFICSGATHLDCMSLGNLFWRFFNKTTGEEYFLNRTSTIIPASSARKNWFRSTDNIIYLEGGKR